MTLLFTVLPIAVILHLMYLARGDEGNSSMVVANA
jgi:hypothetical protein